MWREFEFRFMVLRQAIIPKVSIADAIKNWGTIKNDLLERTRKRKAQLELIKKLKIENLQSNAKKIFHIITYFVVLIFVSGTKF